MGQRLLLQIDGRPRLLEFPPTAIQVQFTGLEPATDHFEIAQGRVAVGVPLFLRVEHPLELFNEVQPLVGQRVGDSG